MDPRTRVLPRSLVPLPGESLPGYLLRLAHRLEQPPGHLAAITGLARSRVIPSMRLLRADPGTLQRFAAAAGLTSPEAAGLFLGDLGNRYPPLDLAPGGRMRQASGITGLGRWVFTQSTRYCPQCLAGDGSLIQQHHGGAWQKTWRLPVIFACTTHQRLLTANCPHCRTPVHANPALGLLARPGDVLHPAQCRSAACGHRLDHAAGAGHQQDTISSTLLAIQQQLAGLLRPGGPATTTSLGHDIPVPAYFLDLRLITGLITMTWPDGRYLVPPGLARAAGEHISQQRENARQARQQGRRVREPALHQAPPLRATACAGLITAASQLLATSDLRAAAQQLRPLISRASQMVPWHPYFRQAQPTCSPRLATVIASQLTELRPPSRRGANHAEAADARAGAWWQDRRRQQPPTCRACHFDHRHLPQYLPACWLERHFRQLTGLSEQTLRRAAPIRLIQMTQPISVRAAAALLGIPPGISQTAAVTLGRWTRADPANHLSFHSALDALAEELDTTASLTDYARRREALATWTIPPADWTTLTAGFKPRSPVCGDRERLIASVLIWMQITDGEHHLAPLIRQDRATAGPHQLTRDVQRARNQRHADPAGHYAALTAHLTPYARQLAASIDAQPDPGGPANVINGQLT